METARYADPQFTPLLANGQPRMFKVAMSFTDNSGPIDTTKFECRLRECACSVFEEATGVLIVSTWLDLNDLYGAIAFDVPLCSVLSIQPLDPPPPSILLAA
jgi:hypothetical protein